jgi:hypothetical protein
VACASTQAGPHDAHGKAHGLRLGVAFAQADADGGDHLHAVGKSHHHDQRRHDVEEEVQAESQPAQQAQRPQHREHRRQRRQQHQRHALEEDHGDGGAEQQAQAVVDDLVALHRVADLELHDRRTRQVRLEANGRQLLLQLLADAADDRLGSLFRYRLAVERDDGQRQLAVRGEELALDDVVVAHLLNDCIVLGPVRQVVGHDRRWVAAGVRLATGRQHGNEAVYPVGQLQVDDGAPERLQLRLLEEIFAFDHHQHVVFAGGEAPIDLLVAPELLGVGAEELRERVVHPEPGEPPQRQSGHDHDQRKGDGRRREPDQAEPLQPERKGPSWRCVHAGVHHPPEDLLVS